VRSVPRGTLCSGVIVCIMVYVYSPYYEETETSYAAPTAKEDFPAAGFGGRGQGSAGIAAGLAEILSADQEADYFASGRRRSGVVPKTGAGLPDEDQSGAAEVDVGREKFIRGVRKDPLWQPGDVSHLPSAHNPRHTMKSPR